MQNAAERAKSNAERSKTAPMYCSTQQNGIKIMRKVQKGPKFVQNAAKGSQICRTQQNGTKLWHNVATRHKIKAERLF